MAAFQSDRTPAGSVSPEADVRPQYLLDTGTYMPVMAKRPQRIRMSRRFLFLVLGVWAVAIGLAFVPAWQGPKLFLYALPVWSLAAGSLIFWYAHARKRHRASLQDHRERQHTLLRLAYQDLNTNLPNGAALEIRIDQHIEPGLPITCLSVGIGGIRSASELLGPRGSDTLLLSIVRRLQGCAPAEDYLGRFSADRFIVLVSRRHSTSDIASLASMIVDALSAPHLVLERNLPASVSIGIASYPADAGDRDQLLAASDRAMRAAISDGGNSYRFAADLYKPLHERNNIIATRLERALMQNALHLHYQPIFTQSERMIAVEALARWQDAEHGLVSPGEFIPIAEATGLIVPLSNWVLREACEQMVQWLRLGTSLERICVNVSVKQIWRNDFPRVVQQTLDATGLAPQHLELEVTESALATDFATVKEHLQTLRRIGIRISIDDFGTGYSSLHRLRDLDADVLKIDRTFVQGAHDTPSGIAVVQSIIDLAHRLRLTVIAEGVETHEELQMLVRFGCEELQGFLLAHPQTPEALTITLRSAAAQASQGPLRLVPRIA